MSSFRHDCLGLYTTGKVLLNLRLFVVHSRRSWPICIWCVYRMTWLIRSELQHIRMFHISAINLDGSCWMGRDGRFGHLNIPPIEMQIEFRCDMACIQADFVMTGCSSRWGGVYEKKKVNTWIQNDLRL